MPLDDRDPPVATNGAGVLSNSSKQFSDERDLRIDFFRGIALVMIFVNHIPGNPMSFFTQRNWGFSDSAEVFVLLAGISAALAYGRFFDRDAFVAGAAAVFSRVWTLYVTHLMLFLVLAAICVMAAEKLNETTYLETIGFDVFLQNPAAYVVNVITLTFQPGYLDILPLYIVLLAMLPVLFLLAGRHWALPLALSAILYAVIQATLFNLPNVRVREWFFNPFAWQLVFITGFTIGWLVRHPDRRPAIGRNVARWLTGLATTFTLASLLATAPWRELPGLENVFLVNPASLGTISKSNQHIARYLDVIAKFWLVLVMVDAAAGWLRHRAARPFIAMGRHSLEVFALSVVLSVAGGILATVHDFAPLALAIVNAAGFVVLAALGLMLEWRRTSMAAVVARPAPEALPAPAETRARLARETAT